MLIGTVTESERTKAGTPTTKTSALVIPSKAGAPKTGSTAPASTGSIMDRLRKVDPSAYHPTTATSVGTITLAPTQNVMTCPNGAVIPMPPPPTYLIPPLLSLSPARWEKAAADKTPIKIKLDYDLKQFFPQFNNTARVQALELLVPGGFNTLSDTYISDQVQAAYLNAPRLVPLLAALNIPAENADLIARYVLAPQAILHAYGYVSYRVTYLDGAWGTWRRGWLGPDDKSEYVVDVTKELVPNYRGLEWTRNGVKEGILPQVVEGRVPMWIIPQPFGNKKNRWAVYIRYIDRLRFEFTLLDVGEKEEGILESIVGVLRAVLNFGCKLITNEKLQSIANTAALIPSAEAKTAAAAWGTAANACGYLMPGPGPAPFDPCLATTPPPPTELPNFWEQHKTKILVGGAALAAVLGLRAYRQRQVR